MEPRGIGVISQRVPGFGKNASGSNPTTTEMGVESAVLPTFIVFLPSGNSVCLVRTYYRSLND